MESQWQPIQISEEMLEKVRKSLAEGPQVLGFSANRHLCSLAASLAIIGEIGTEVDRLSGAVGLDLKQFAGANPWSTELIRFSGELGVRLWCSHLEEFENVDQGLAELLHPLSLDHEGRIKQLFLFPGPLADQFAKNGIELVVVREWILNGVLATPAETGVNYFRANTWEMKSNIALLQARLIFNRQLAFFGTHDLMDHLAGADPVQLAAWKPKMKTVLEALESTFPTGAPPRNFHLIVSYLLAIVLDDMAQPIWYGSPAHKHALERFLKLLEDPAWRGKDLHELFVPARFAPISRLLRSESANFEKELESEIGSLLEELKQRA